MPRCGDGVLVQLGPGFEPRNPLLPLLTQVLAGWANTFAWESNHPLRSEVGGSIPRFHLYVLVIYQSWVLGEVCTAG